MRIGSLCSGYGGLDHAVEEVFGATTAWVSDIDKGACKILAHRYPDVPNIGDMTTVDWATLESVEILTAGYPCQPFSHAGRRKGTTDVRHLWPYVRQAIRVLRPRLTVLENVAGHRSLGFDRVLGDLAEDGIHVRWTSLRAADIGAPHGRERLFIVVTRDAAGRDGFDGLHPRQGPLGGAHSASAPDADRAGRGEHGRPVTVRAEQSPAQRLGDAALTLLPTPAVNDMGAGKTVEDWDDWTDDMKARHGNGNGHGKSLAIEAQRLLPTPMAYVRGDDTIWMPERPEQLHMAPNDGGTPWLDSAAAYVAEQSSWGDYAAAIARWEHVLGRPAPAPTMTSTKGNPQLSPAFVEWMQGLPAGWVTDVPGITRNEALKALGNGVVPQQAVAALRTMLAWTAVA